eukprot:GGOE01041422.1.p1 GENE.GGOE01041422.1~~GGOE01041422.1.p1  ORF type:complete len:204 (+),score=82.58 GGOE01041422.1:78-689(+)
MSRSPAAREQGSPQKKKLTREEQENLAHKLYEQSMDKKKAWNQNREHALLAECKFKPAKRLTSEDEEELVKHLYHMQMEQMAKAKEKRLAELEKGSTVCTKRLTETELTDSIDRMYAQEKDHRSQKANQLVAKYQPPLKNKVLGPDSIKGVNERLYENEKGKFQKRREELYQKYIAPLEPTFTTLSADQVAAMATRLSTTNRE